MYKEVLSGLIWAKWWPSTFFHHPFQYPSPHWVLHLYLEPRVPAHVNSEASCLPPGFTTALLYGNCIISTSHRRKSQWKLRKLYSSFPQVITSFQNHTFIEPKEECFSYIICSIRERKSLWKIKKSGFTYTFCWFLCVKCWRSKDTL